MKRVKRNWAILLIVSLLTAVLSGCGAGNETGAASEPESGRQLAADEQENQENNQETVTNETEENTGGQAVLLHAGSEYMPFLNTVAEKFAQETGIEVILEERETQDTLDTIQLDGAAGIGPDITLIPYDRIGQFASQGIIAEVTLPNDGSFAAGNILQVSYDGKVYGAPAIVEAIVMYYNKDILDKAPITFKELEELAEDSRFADGDKTVAFLAPLNAPYIVYGLLSAYGGYVFGDEGTNPNDIGLNNAGSVEAVEYAKTWFDRWPAGMLDLQTNGNLVMDQFTSGKAAVMIGGPWDAAAIKETGINYGVAKIPVLNNGSEYKPFGGGKSWVISNYSTNQENARQFLTYLCSSEVQFMMYELKNEVPANLTAQEEIKKGDDELVKAVIEQYQYASPTPNIPEMSEYWGITGDMLFDAYKGDMSVQEALDKGVNTLKETIETKYGE